MPGSQGRRWRPSRCGNPLGMCCPALLAGALSSGACPIRSSKRDRAPRPARRGRLLAQLAVDPGLELPVGVRVRRLQRGGVLGPQHQDGLRPGGDDARGGAARQQARQEARDAARQRGVRPRGGEAHGGPHAAPDEAAEHRPEVDHGVDEEVLHHVQQVRARHQAVGDARGLDERGAAHGGLHVRPLAEVLEEVPDARDDALQQAEDDAADHVAGVLRVRPALPEDRLEGPDRSNEEGPAADAAEGSGQGHTQAPPQHAALPVHPEVPTTEHATIRHVTDVVRDLPANDEDQDCEEVQDVLRRGS
mmetsp:Transcript_61783/g.141405  ORF Transcript_61783/g.141405 Transcript_61783/m.141405 type:complete len:305 (+) Transcript_61783:223-1137(+)